VQKLCGFFKIFVFPKIIINEFTEETKIFFFGFLGPTNINPRSYVSSLITKWVLPSFPFFSFVHLTFFFLKLKFEKSLKKILFHIIFIFIFIFLKINLLTWTKLGVDSCPSFLSFY